MSDQSQFDSVDSETTAQIEDVDLPGSSLSFFQVYPEVRNLETTRSQANATQEIVQLMRERYENEQARKGVDGYLESSREIVLDRQTTNAQN